MPDISAPKKMELFKKWSVWPNVKMAASAAFGKQRHKPAQSWLGTVWCKVKRTGFLLSSFFYAAFYIRCATESDTATRL